MSDDMTTVLKTLTLIAIRETRHPVFYKHITRAQNISQHDTCAPHSEHLQSDIRGVDSLIVYTRPANSKSKLLFKIRELGNTWNKTLQTKYLSLIFTGSSTVIILCFTIVLLKITRIY